MSEVRGKAAIKLAGCDGSTDIIINNITEDQLDFLKKIAAVSGEGGCEPALRVADNEHDAHEEFIAWNQPTRQEWETEEEFHDRLVWAGVAEVTLGG